jgi:hypothetical protein
MGNVPSVPEFSKLDAIGPGDEGQRFTDLVGERPGYSL